MKRKVASKYLDSEELSNRKFSKPVNRIATYPNPGSNVDPNHCIDMTMESPEMISPDAIQRPKGSLKSYFKGTDRNIDNQVTTKSANISDNAISSQSESISDISKRPSYRADISSLSLKNFRMKYGGSSGASTDHKDPNHQIVKESKQTNWSKGPTQNHRSSAMKYGSNQGEKANSSKLQNTPLNRNMDREDTDDNPSPFYEGESPEEESKFNMKDLESIVQPITLSNAQMKVLKAIAEGKSVFFTGAAGSGKSYILRILQDIFGITHRKEKIAFTAPTGVAACNIGGLTINSWSSIGTGESPENIIISKAMGNKVVINRWTKTSILVIDEISMMSAHVFDLLSRMGTMLRNNSKPFGGIQVVLCGDFFQLPPIGLSDSGKNGKKIVNFCFESETWRELFGDYNGNSMGISSSSSSSASAHQTHHFRDNDIVVLDTIFRQKDDTFLTVLNDVRLNMLSDRTKQILEYKNLQGRNLQSTLRLPMKRTESTSSEEEQMDIQFTKLFAINREVDACNSKELACLPPLASENPEPTSSMGIKSLQNAGKDCIIRYKAMDRGEKQYLDQLINGLKAPDILDLKVGAQVMLVKNIDVPAGLVNGARGVVSRFVSLLDGLPDANIEHGNNEILPEIVFSVSVGNNKSTITRVIEREKWDMTENDKELASRIQIPLILAWAISIHKAQGMTIPYLDLSFTGIFEFGQAYVALSRATDLDGLILRNFSTNVIKTNRKVIDFYKSVGFDPTKTSTKENSSSKSQLVTANLYELIKLYGDILDLSTEDYQMMEDYVKDAKIDLPTSIAEAIATEPRKEYEKVTSQLLPSNQVMKSDVMDETNEYTDRPFSMPLKEPRILKSQSPYDIQVNRITPETVSPSPSKAHSNVDTHMITTKSNESTSSNGYQKSRTIDNSSPMTTVRSHANNMTDANNTISLLAQISKLDSRSESSNKYIKSVSNPTVASTMNSSHDNTMSNNISGTWNSPAHMVHLSQISTQSESLIHAASPSAMNVSGKAMYSATNDMKTKDQETNRISPSIYGTSLSQLLDKAKPSTTTASQVPKYNNTSFTPISSNPSHQSWQGYRQYMDGYDKGVSSSIHSMSPKQVSYLEAKTSNSYTSPDSNIYQSIPPPKSASRPLTEEEMRRIQANKEAAEAKLRMNNMKKLQGFMSEGKDI